MDGESKMKNRMHAWLATKCMHPTPRFLTLWLFSNDVVETNYDMGLFITDFDFHN
jgi:hypothetical protein